MYESRKVNSWESFVLFIFTVYRVTRPIELFAVIKRLKWNNLFFDAMYTSVHKDKDSTFLYQVTQIVGEQKF